MPPIAAFDLSALLRRLAGNEQLVLLILALLIGGAAAAGAILLRESIAFGHYLFLGVWSERLVTGLAGQPWWRILLAPVLGGLLVGLIVRYLMPGGQPQGVPHVIEASALRGGRMSGRQGLWAAVASVVSLGSGASVGREGPAVHLGAAIASWLARRFNLGRARSRTLLGCGVAAAVAASFNAPIAGVFFALEVVIGHYALHAFAPIVVASVAGTIVSRLHFGDFPAFILPPHEIVSFWEFPAFALLGVMSAVTAIVFMRSTILCEEVAQRLPLPTWMLPAVGGLAVGAIGLVFPDILAVGYESTDMALRESYAIEILIALVVAKTAATAISLGFGFNGGVFSPALFLGAMLGGAFGVVATQPFPELSSGHGAYTLIGMGAVAAAVLGAPISTILMMFELTGDYALTIGVMVAVTMASVITLQVHGHSFFTEQLERRGLNLKGGHEVGLLRSLRVQSLMRGDHAAVSVGDGIDVLRARLADAPHGELFVVDAEGGLFGTITLHDLGHAAFDPEEHTLLARDVARPDPPVLALADDLERAVALFADVEEGVLPVVDTREDRRLLGTVHERDVMRAYNKALIALRAEEHGEETPRP